MNIPDDMGPSEYYTLALRQYEGLEDVTHPVQVTFFWILTRMRGADHE